MVALFDGLPLVVELIDGVTDRLALIDELIEGVADAVEDCDDVTLLLAVEYALVDCVALSKGVLLTDGVSDRVILADCVAVTLPVGD